MSESRGIPVEDACEKLSDLMDDFVDQDLIQEAFIIHTLWGAMVHDATYGDGAVEALARFCILVHKELNSRIGDGEDEEDSDKFDDPDDLIRAVRF